MNCGFHTTSIRDWGSTENPDSGRQEQGVTIYREESMGKRKKVIFLCCHNSVLSQMAEALVRKHSGDQFEVYSAGLSPLPIHPLAKL